MSPFKGFIFLKKKFFSSFRYICENHQNEHSMKVLVTGGTGFIGSHTIVQLVEAGHTPVIVDNLSNSEMKVLDGLEGILGVKPKFYRADCTDKSVFKEICESEKPGAIIHFAAFKAVGESVENPLAYYKNNIGSMTVVLETMKECGIWNLVFSSSCTVYGQPDTLPVTETTPDKDAASPYGYTKVVCEQMVRDVCASDARFKVALLRYFNPIGAHKSGLIGELPNGVPSNLIPFVTQTAAGLRNKLTVFGNDYNTQDGSCIRDFIHVVDLAKAHVASMAWLDSAIGGYEIFNIGQGKGNTVLEVVKAFVKVTGVELPYEIGPRRAGDIEKIWADVTKSTEVLKWKTELNMEDALVDAWNWQLKLAARS
jgi:UDP-glucose 4-epimerase